MTGVARLLTGLGAALLLAAAFGALTGCAEEGQLPRLKVYITNSTQDNLRLFSPDGPHVAPGERYHATTMTMKDDLTSVQLLRSGQVLAWIQITCLQSTKPFDPLDPDSGEVIVDLDIGEPVRNQFVISFPEPADTKWVKVNVFYPSDPTPLQARSPWSAASRL